MRYAGMFVLLTLLLSACSPLPDPPTPVLSATQAPVAGPTPSPTESPCFWRWSRQDLPEVAAEVQTTLDAAGVGGGQAKARAEAYGEDCVDPETNEVRYFTAMETDFYVTLPVDDLADRQALGEILLDLLKVLDRFPPESTPGPQPGYVGVNFVAGEEEMRLWFSLIEAAGAREEGLRGEALFEALNR